MNCRHCGSPLGKKIIDLGKLPHSNAYLTKDRLGIPEKKYPLRIRLCEKCWLVQTEDYVRAGELFHPDYAYLSSTSTSWVDHNKKYAYKIIKELKLNKNSLVVEVGSNDGYLLKNFLNAGIPCLGIEPAINPAKAAKKLGIPVINKFFSAELACYIVKHFGHADLIVGNNVYAHVPDINNFTRGLENLLKQEGVVTLEFPHLAQLLKKAQFDTIYHEHFSYLSLSTVNSIFRTANLKIWKVEKHPTHGGSLRIYGCKAAAKIKIHPSVKKVLLEEKREGLQNTKAYATLKVRAEKIKNNFISFLKKSKLKNQKVAAYGAAAKGNTLLNYAKITKDLVPYVCDAAPSKKGKFMPGSHIPIVDENQLKIDQPKFIVLLPWNLTSELKKQLSYTKKWGAKLVVAFPHLKVIG